jgi:hypothetical protein
MQRSGWDARRRNKNLGTAKSGYGQNNEMRIPDRWIGTKWIQFHERLENFVVVKRTIGEREIIFVIEPVQPGFIHACTPDEITQVLRSLPQAHTADIDLIVLRQPKRKEKLLQPVWGRLRYWTEISRYTGVAIYLEAQPMNDVFFWQKSLSPDYVQELERLRQDGHQIVVERRRYVIQTTLKAVRTTQLFRTLPHEVGHYVDRLNHIDEHGDSELFWTKPDKDKEAFAHRYADEFQARERALGRIPFDRIIDESALISEGISPLWFTPLTNVCGLCTGDRR